MLTELSESFGLFAMTDPKKIMEKLSMLLRNNNLYREFVLVKFERDDFPEQLKNDINADPVFSKTAVAFLDNQDFNISEKFNKANITKDMYAKDKVSR